MKISYVFILFLVFVSNYAQITGKITDEKGKPLPFVNIIEEGSYQGTSSNDGGEYALAIKTLGNHTILFQYLGYKAQKISIQVDKLPCIKNITLLQETITLSEVVINPKNNPGNSIIKKAIASKQEKSNKTSHFKADFYSRGIYKLKNMPKKIFGQKVEDRNGVLDSTGSGVVYLSETVSKIIFEKPNNLNEKIIASKVSGQDKGFSFNTAKSSIYDFYNNTVKFGDKMISPLADNAFNYYIFKLVGTFEDENHFTINKIKVVAKRDSEPVFDGYIYIVEDSWAIYAIDLKTKGYRVHQEFVNTIQIKQNFSYNNNNTIWAKNTQSIALSFGAMGIEMLANYSYVYSNYQFVKEFPKNTFTNEILSFEKDSNKKDSLFWKTNRPIPLTLEEQNDYIKKDKIKTRVSSQKYLDSVDKKQNKFEFVNPINGYSWRNSTTKKSFHYDGLFKLSSLSFNTVQGWNLASGLHFQDYKKQEQNGQMTRISAKFNYGFSDDRFRFTGMYYHLFNNKNFASLSITGGTVVNHFNPEEPISKFINTVSTLFFKENYSKLYNKEFAKLNYSQNLGNNFVVIGSLEYQNRNPLFNTTSQSFVQSNTDFSSNNPLLPNDHQTPAFDPHQLVKASVSTKITFGNKYISMPERKIIVRNNKYPTLFLNFENAFASSQKKHEYQSLSGDIKYDFVAGNKGVLGINLKAGKFFNAQDISFVDYKHFNGNQTHIGTANRYLNVFNLMPYYSNSTNDSYFEAHLEHDDKGYIMNKIPLLNKLNATLILGFHTLAVPKTSPYTEYTIGLDQLGIGKFKMLRLDYVYSNQNGVQQNGFVFGLKILDLMN